MIERAFRVLKGSNLCNNYWKEKQARDTFRKLGCSFMESVRAECSKFMLSRRLIMELSETERERYADQLMKNQNVKGFFKFRLNTPMQKAWEKKVVRQTAWVNVNALCGWFLDFGMIHGGYSIWDDGKDVYCLLDPIEGDITVPDGVEEIKLSEYYRIIESLEDKK